jgi:predicted NAD/FAD-dependent oxidoreductase
MYDTIIIGGGIGGLYTAYQLSKMKMENILVLEKNNILGGRVYTYHDKHMTVDAGAGRFHLEHTLLIQLIRELGLSGKIVEITSSAVFAPSDGTGSIMNSILDAPDSILRIPAGDVALSLLDVSLGNRNIPSSGLITRVIASSKLRTENYLRNISFIDFAKKVLKPREAQFILDTFGYYSEIIIMNAYDAIKLMMELGPGQKFYVMAGGLSQIISGLEKKCVSGGVRIMKGKSVSRVEYVDNEFLVYCEENLRPYKSNRCICALPSHAVQTLKFKGLKANGAGGWKKMLGEVLSAPLCRIYAKYHVGVGGVWFNGFSKMTTNNPLRMIIPISEKDGIIMISYSDNIFAKFWKRLFDKGGIGLVEKEIIRLIKMSTGVDIPFAITMKMFYWEHGVGYWGVGANSSLFYKDMMQPSGSDVELYLCGENFSENYQQWMEGALETSSRVIECIKGE